MGKADEKANRQPEPGSAIDASRYPSLCETLNQASH